MSIPAPGSIAQHRANAEFAGWIWAIVEIDPAVLDETVERINITLPRRILNRLDAKARAAGASRSGFIARTVLTC